MEALSPQSVGREFVRQYYTLLNKAPLHLHRFYSGDSSFVHGGLDKEDKMLEPVHGQQEIHEKIMQLNFRDCKAKIRHVDAHATLASGVVVQVLGELSNNHQPMRRFMQTFVLAPQTPKKYYVYNDIFRYQDEVFNEDYVVESVEDSGKEADKEDEDEDEDDGIETVSILDGVKDSSTPPHLNGGGTVEPRLPMGIVLPADSDDKVSSEHPTAATTEQPAVVQPPSPTPVEAVPPTPSSETVEAVEKESNEKPTYANLFKKAGGGGAMVASGPLSLPPAGFNKAPSQSSSSSTLSPPSSNDKFKGKNSGVNKRALGTTAKDSGGGSRDRYHPSRESVSSGVGEDIEVPGGGQGGQGGQGRGQRGGGSRMGMNSLSNYPDSQQVFVGNLPHYCQERDLEDLFSKFGKVVDVRINTKGVAQSKNLPDNSQKSVPNFGFVVFEDEKAANECLSQKPINLPNGHRLNVETKKKNNRDDGKGAFGGSSSNRGSGSNFDRGSQEQLGGIGRGGLNANSGRGNPRGGSRGGGRGGFSGGRGSGPPGGAAIPGAGNAQQRTTYTRRS